MSDEFLDDISSAVESSGEVKTESTVTEPRIVPEMNEHRDSTETENSLSDMFDASDPNFEEPKVEEPAKVETVEPVKEEVVKKKEEPATPAAPSTDKNERVLDTFLAEDAKGNLVDSDGNVIATTGKSRHSFERLKKEGRRQRNIASEATLKTMELSKQFKSLYDESQEIAKNGYSNPVQSIVKDSGVTETQAKMGLQLMKDYKQDPINAIKKLLTQAKIDGIDVGKIGANISVDPAMLRESVQQMFKDQQEANKPQATEATQQEQAAQVARDFLSNNPDSRPYVQTIVDAKTKFPNMSLEEVWHRVKIEIDKRAYKDSKSDTMLRKPVPPKIPARKVTVAPVDYGNMTFAQIAESIEKENS
jgi:hypothetical protein